MGNNRQNLIKILEEGSIEIIFNQRIPYVCLDTDKHICKTIKIGDHCITSYNGVGVTQSLMNKIKSKIIEAIKEEDNKFETILWSKVQNMLLNNSDMAYVTLYNELRIASNNKQFDNCNNFLLHIIHEDLNTDCIVHIINILSPHKDKLSSWNYFMHNANTKIILVHGRIEGDKLWKALISN